MTETEPISSIDPPPVRRRRRAGLAMLALPARCSPQDTAGAGSRAQAGPARRNHRLEHPPLRGRNRLLRHHREPRRHRKVRQEHRRRAAADPGGRQPGFGADQLRQRLRRRRFRHLAARPGRGLDPGAAERPPHGALRPGRRRPEAVRRPEHDPDRRRRPHRGAEGRRLGHLRFRRHRRRGQHHPAQGLHGNTVRVLAGVHRGRRRPADQPSPSPRASATSTRTATTSCSASNTRSSTRSGTATAPTATGSARSTCGPGAIPPSRRWAAPAPSSPAAAWPAAPSTATCAGSAPPATISTAATSGRITGFTRNSRARPAPNFTSHPQGDPGGGCLIDAPSRLQPDPRRNRKTSASSAAAPSRSRRTSRRIPSSTTTPAVPNPRPRRPRSAARSAIRADRSTTPSSRSAPNHPDNPYSRQQRGPALPGRRRRPARVADRLGLHALDRRRQGQQLRLGLGHGAAVLAQPRQQHPERLPAARRRLRPAQPDCGQRGGRAVQQPGLCGAAARHLLAHRRECRPELAGLYAALSPTINNTANTKLASGTSRPRASSAASRLAATSAWRSAPNGATRKPSCSRPPAPSAATSSAWAIRPTGQRATCSPCTPRRWRRCPTTSRPRRRCAGTTSPTSATPTRRRPA
jgi:hypothetical protein